MRYVLNVFSAANVVAAVYYVFTDNIELAQLMMLHAIFARVASQDAW